MKDDYLWDGSGECDPEIRKLEMALGRFRHDRPTPRFPAVAEAARRVRWWGLGRAAWRRVFGVRPLPAFVTVSATLLAVGVVWLVLRQSKRTPVSLVQRPECDVTRLAGAPRVGSKAIGEGSGAGKLAVGQTLVTDSSSRANITMQGFGEVEVEPDTRLSLLEAGSAQKRLALERGTIHAAIWAPPGEFVVDTPFAVAVDLGCAYTLHVDDSGSGLLRTTLGWVGFKLDGRESFIPAGAVCATRPGTGPGIPYFEDAPEQFRAALAQLDFPAAGAAERSAELRVVLSQARQRDALTLWHLLARVNPSERGGVYDRLAALVPPPPQVTREGVLRRDQTMLDLWWNKLGFGDIGLWRAWERSWSQGENHRN